MPTCLVTTHDGERLHLWLAERGIEVVKATHPVRFENGRLQTVPGDHLYVDAVVSLPKLEGRRIRGVLHDPDGSSAPPALSGSR